MRFFGHSLLWAVTDARARLLGGMRTMPDVDRIFWDNIYRVGHPTSKEVVKMDLLCRP